MLSRTLLAAAAAAATLAAGAAQAADFSQVSPVRNAVGAMRWSAVTVPDAEERNGLGIVARYTTKDGLRGFMNMGNVDITGKALATMPLPDGARVDMRQRALSEATGLLGLVPFYVVQTVEIDVEKETSIPIVLDMERLNSDACLVEFKNDGSVFDSGTPKAQGKRPAHMAVTPHALFATPGKHTLSATTFCWRPQGAAVAATLGYLGEEGFVPFDKGGAPAKAAAWGHNRGELVAGKPSWKAQQGPIKGDSFDKSLQESLDGVERVVEGPLSLYDKARQSIGQNGAKSVLAVGVLRPTAVGDWQIALTETTEKNGDGYPTSPAALLVRSGGAWQDVAIIASSLNAPQVTAVGTIRATEADVSVGLPITVLAVARGDVKNDAKAQVEVLLRGPGETRFRPATVEITPN